MNEENNKTIRLKEMFRGLECVFAPTIPYLYSFDKLLKSRVVRTIERVSTSGTF
ncbi:MAG: hypothetical protein P0Y49_06160 [Candidatus Pedobacter colombiensis]|uniref:Uncharacterized protein n=1 Tax=Candidatus Pedobacter colombiensis TaxID=3121371 RepID=A0AAJ5WAE9_9SPHI|nr:hypothetical protein [Pedobacter sp.]WEK20720.1 MAG: hypothetical protein P0Y49_06160 [Pedobacter sp.]